MAKTDTPEAPKADKWVPDLCKGCARNGDCSKQDVWIELLGKEQMDVCGIYLKPSKVGKGDNPPASEVHTILKPADTA